MVMCDVDRAQANTGQRVSSPVVQQRLHTLLELAIAIGRREGLLGDRTRPELNGAEPAVGDSGDIGRTASNETGLPQVDSQLEGKVSSSLACRTSPEPIKVASDQGMSKRNEE